MSKELVEIVRCKNCIHRPVKGEGDHDIDPPKYYTSSYDDYSLSMISAAHDWWKAVREREEEKK